MTSFPVLDGNTKDAMIIGEATTEAEAMAMLAALYADHDMADAAAPAAFIFRDAAYFSADIAADCPNGAWEPIWAKA